MGQFIQVSGQGGARTPDGAHRVESVEKQTVQALSNVEAILREGGCTFADVIMIRVYLTSRDNFPAMNEAYERFLREHNPSAAMPARTTLISGLPGEDMEIEIDALAIRGN